MSATSDTIARLKVIATSAVTYLVTAAFVIGVIRDEVAKAFPESPVTEWLTWFAGIALGVIAVAVVIIRRVTPVLPAARGILPPPTGTPQTPLEVVAIDAGLATPPE